MDEVATYVWGSPCPHGYNYVATERARPRGQYCRENCCDGLTARNEHGVDCREILSAHHQWLTPLAASRPFRNFLRLASLLCARSRTPPSSRGAAWLAGRLAMRWQLSPPAVSPHSVMPELGSGPLKAALKEYQAASSTHDASVSSAVKTQTGMH